jgi:hypothetical protein
MQFLELRPPIFDPLRDMYKRLGPS